MRNSGLGFILKVFAASTLLSVLVKYGGRYLPVAPTSLNALVIVLLPTVVMAIVLWWRSQSDPLT
ncbi:MAG: hypothetical protein ACOC3E_02070 [Cyanobacteriota bacterium]